ncbi:MAG: ABC transporter permease [Actinomycetota bacterium]|nr:ABC transporter permease [Actinomycetota bacterium]
MTAYVVRRIVQMVIVLFGASLVLFASLFVVPGDPIDALAGEGPSLDAATRARLHERYHLDDSFPEQYVRWLSRVVQGDLGESYRLRQPVNDLIGQKFGNTFDLALAAIICEVAIGLVAGAVAAAFGRSFLGTLVHFSTTLAIGIPVFVIGLGLQQLFALRLDWLPLAGQQEGLRSIVLPALTLGAIHAAMLARLTRASVLEVVRSDYIRTARATGLPRRRVIGKHALRPSVIPAVTYLGVGFGGLLGGSFVVETIFNWDGLGRVMVASIQAQDNPVILGMLVYGVVAFVVVNLLVDISYAVLDPRVRLT